MDTTQQFQTMDGFGFCLTGGSAGLINSLPNSIQNTLLQDLFGTDSTNIGISYLRISIGASDLSADLPYTYDDMADGQTDVNLQYFSIQQETYNLIPILKKILAINPSLKILGSPWSAPAWMKTSDSLVAGSLDTAYFHVYANYFVKYLQAMQSNGITLDAITVQNEPLNAYNNPCMVMQATDEALFVRKYLGPAFQQAGISTKIIVWDHNCDVPDYPITVLSDTIAYKYIDGSAFHLYAGDISALSQVHAAFPNKNVYFTEQWISGPSNFPGDFSWHMQNLILGAPLNWSKNVLEWNLASSPSYLPHTQGGCSTCLGGITVDGDSYVRNTGYYIIAHASKFVRPGSVRVGSSTVSNLLNVAYQRTDGKKVLIVYNTSSSQTQLFNIVFKGKSVATSLGPGSAGTYVW